MDRAAHAGVRKERGPTARVRRRSVRPTRPGWSTAGSGESRRRSAWSRTVRSGPTGVGQMSPAALSASAISASASAVRSTSGERTVALGRMPRVRRPMLERDGALHVRAAVVHGLGHRQQPVVDLAGGGRSPGPCRRRSARPAARGRGRRSRRAGRRRRTWCAAGTRRGRTGSAGPGTRGAAPGSRCPSGACSAHRSWWRTRRAGRRSRAGCRGCSWPWCCPGTGTGSAAARSPRRWPCSGPAGRRPGSRSAASRATGRPGRPWRRRRRPAGPPRRRPWCPHR